MKILILTEGGQSIGFGHIARCLAVYQAFKREHIRPQFIINGDASVNQFCKDTKVTVTNWLNMHSFKKIVDGAHVVIIDSYLADLSYYRYITNSVSVPVYFDDCNRLPYPEGIIVNSLIYAHTIRYKKSNKFKHLLGMQYIPLREEWWNPRNKEITRTIKNILITFGGTDTRTFSNAVTNQLQEIYQDSTIVNCSKKWLQPCEIYKVMYAADICISGGGQTIYELTGSGVPTIGVCLSKNQLKNLQYCAKKELVEFIGWNTDKDILKRLMHVLTRMNFHKRIHMSERGRKQVDGKGAQRIVKEVLYYANN